MFFCLSNNNGDWTSLTESGLALIPDLKSGPESRILKGPWKVPRDCIWVERRRRFRGRRLRG